MRRRGAELIGYVQATVDPMGRAGIAYQFNSRYWRPGYGREASQVMLAELTNRYAVREFTAVLKRANFRSLGLLQRLGFVPAPADLLAQTGIEPDEIMLHRQVLHRETWEACRNDTDKFNVNPMIAACFLCLVLSS